MGLCFGVSTLTPPPPVVLTAPLQPPHAGRCPRSLGARLEAAARSREDGTGPGQPHAAPPLPTALHRSPGTGGERARRRLPAPSRCRGPPLPALPLPRQRPRGGTSGGGGSSWGGRCLRGRPAPPARRRHRCFCCPGRGRPPPPSPRPSGRERARRGEEEEEP